MAGNGLRKEVRRRLYAFVGWVARWVSDSRRQRFLQEMILGLVVGGHVHLTKIARAVGSGMTNVHAAEKRLRRHLDSEHWSMQPVIDGLLASSAERVGEGSLIVADLTDVAKYYARSLEGLGRVRDGSDPEKRTAPGYMLFEAYVRVRRWQLFPLAIEPLKTYAAHRLAKTTRFCSILRGFAGPPKDAERGCWTAVSTVANSSSRCSNRRWPSSSGNGVIGISGRRTPSRCRSNNGPPQSTSNTVPGAGPAKGGRTPKRCFCPRLRSTSCC